ncbi:LapA family protein [uncultured Moraxella sp.]|uniref:LapA family protein n=1 Tax=uncultured Moraxella sp. TaxID=263769 RepID=UPI0025E1398E|nr:LapA family protein [uncultured Moraxella sp.]
MHIVLIVLLVIAFAYSLALVVLNNQAVTVNLLFSQVANMSLGLVLVATIFLGVLIGVLLALLLFRVLQNKWEISRLKKEVNTIQGQLTDANLKLAEQAKQLELARQNDTLATMTETTVNAPQQQVNHTSS